MATITVRNLDSATKQALRERAARNGHSMEEEARLLLRAGTEGDLLAAGRDQQLQFASPGDPSHAEKEPPYLGSALVGKNVLLIITGGIAAYKSLDLIRRLKERGAMIRTIMTGGATQFITPLSVEALAHSKAHTDLFNREDEHDIGHIRLARDADLIIVAPATANIMAKLAGGIADDLASTVLLAANSKILLAPAMNPAMWNNSATRRNVAQLHEDGVNFVGPDAGEMAESGEAGKGRMAEPLEIISVAETLADNRPKPLVGMKTIITAGPTHEPIDPVRYIANRSSGKQGFAIAQAMARAGAKVILVSGPVNLPAPKNVDLIEVETAEEMHRVVKYELPADIAIMVAAVADWRVANSAEEKIKKKPGAKNPVTLNLTENPDILKFVGHHEKRPDLVIGFAAETEDVIKNATAKLKKKGADWIVANDVSPETGIMGGDSNKVRILSKDGVDEWPDLAKDQVAGKLVEKIVEFFENQTINV